MLDNKNYETLAILSTIEMDTIKIHLATTLGMAKLDARVGNPIYQIIRDLWTNELGARSAAAASTSAAAAAGASTSAAAAAGASTSAAAAAGASQKDKKRGARSLGRAGPGRPAPTREPKKPRLGAAAASAASTSAAAAGASKQGKKRRAGGSDPTRTQKKPRPGAAPAATAAAASTSEAAAASASVLGKKKTGWIIRPRWSSQPSPNKRNPKNQD